MNILENKRVIGISAAFLLAFGGIVYYGYSRTQAFNKAKETINKNISAMESYNSATLKPTESTLDAITKATKRAKKANADVTKALKAYSSFCVSDSKGITTVEFERRVNGTIDGVAKLAGEKGCNLAEPAKKLGMAAFTSATSMNTEEVPYRRFQLRAVERVVSTIINSGAASIEKVYCAPLPENVGELKDEVPYFPLNFEVAFTAKRSLVTDGKTPELQSTLPRVLNAVSTDKEFFLIPSGISITSEFTPAPTDAYKAPALASEGVNFGESAEDGTKPDAGGDVIATRKTGSPDETIRVHMNFQVLYFTGQNH